MQTIYLDISNKGVIPCINAKQNEVGRKFLAIVTDGGIPYNIPSDSIVSVWYEGDSGKGNYTDIGDQPAIEVSGNKISVELIEQMLSVPGYGVITILLNSPTGQQIGLWNIDYCVELVAGVDSEKAEEYYNAFSEAAKNLAQAAKIFTVDPTLKNPGQPADAKETGVQISVERKRIDNIIAIGSIEDWENNEGGQPYFFSDEYVNGLIKTNGVAGYISATVDSLTLSAGEEREIELVGIPITHRPISDVALISTNTGFYGTISKRIDQESTEYKFYFVVRNVTESTLDTGTTDFGAFFPTEFVYISELADARIGPDAEEYPTAGDALRNLTKSAVRYDKEQNLSEEQKAQARENIGAVDESVLDAVFEKKRTEQLFNNENPTLLNGYINGNSFVAAGGYKSILQEVESGKTYCVSRENGYGTRFDVMAVAFADDLTSLAKGTAGYDSERLFQTIIVPENAHYLVVYYYNYNTDTTQSEATIRSKIKIEEGAAYTPGFAYYDYIPTESVVIPPCEFDETVKYEPTRKIYLGANVLTNAPTKGDGWSGNFTDGFTHAAGKSNRISFFSANIEFGATYICEFDTSYTADEFVNVGIGTSYRILAYNGTGHIRLPLKAIGTADADKTLYFYPVAGVNFTISNITLRKIQAKTSTSEEMTLRLDNVRSTAHNSNYGFWNTILGLYALENGVGSTRTLALGYAALKALQGGHRNIAVGTFAMSQMTGGENNIGAGADAMLAVKEAHDNVVLGKAAAYNGANLKNNVVLGAYAMTGTAASVAANNVVIGRNAGWYTTGNDNTFLGYQAGYKVGFANGNTCIGKNAYGETTGNHNTIIGEESGYSASVNNSTAIGYQAKATKSNQMVLGGNNITETLCKGDLVVRGTDGVKRQIVFNADGTCSWVAVE